jgi:hypothetical protein
MDDYCQEPTRTLLLIRCKPKVSAHNHIKTKAQPQAVIDLNFDVDRE